MELLEKRYLFLPARPQCYWTHKLTSGFYQMDFANQLLYHPVLALTKISILLFYHRLSVSGNFRVSVNVLIGINIALTVSIFFADLFQCTPVAFAWNAAIPGGKCMNTKAFYISSAALNIVSDFAVLLLPIPMVWQLKINTRKKIALISLFSLGGLYVPYLPRT